MPPSKTSRQSFSHPPEEPGPREHPLFPPKNEGDDPPDVVTFQVTRWNRTTAAQEWCPRTFQADECTDLQQIADLFGGGKYELFAKGGPNGNRMTARRQYTLPGKPKPLYDTSEEEEPAAPASSVVVQQPTQARAPADVSFMAMLPVLVPVLLEYLKSSAAERAAQFAATNQMMVGMMQTMGNIGAARSGNTGIQDFQAGIAFAENLLEAKMEAMKGEGGGGDDSAAMMDMFEKGLMALQMLKGGNGGAPPAAPGGAG